MYPNLDSQSCSAVMQMCCALSAPPERLQIAPRNVTGRERGGKKVFPPAKASVKGDNKRLTSPGSSCLILPHNLDHRGGGGCGGGGGGGVVSEEERAAFLFCHNV